MSKNGEYDSSMLLKLLNSVRGSVEIIVQEPDVFHLQSEVPTLASLLDLPGPGVVRRAVVCKPNYFHNTESEQAVLRLVPRLFPKGWSVRTSQYTASTGAVIKDDSEALVIDDKSMYQRRTEPRRVSALREHFEKLWSGDQYEVLYEDSIRQQLPSYDQRIITHTRPFWDDVIRRLGDVPNDLYSLDPRRFEELVAEVLTRLGCDVHLTPPSKDGGFDIYARLGSPLDMPLLFLVECKRWAKTRPVGVQIVNALYGVVEKSKATGGMIVTTSSFTRGAVFAQKAVSSRLVLKDYSNLTDWLRFLRPVATEKRRGVPPPIHGL